MSSTSNSQIQHYSVLLKYYIIYTMVNDVYKYNAYYVCHC